MENNDPFDWNDAFRVINEYQRSLMNANEAVTEFTVELSNNMPLPVPPTFTEQIDATPVFALTDNGRGFLPPLFRAYGHILYLSGRQAESPTRKPTDAEVLEELTHGMEHLNIIPMVNISQTSIDKLKETQTIWKTAMTEFKDWTPAVRETNFTKLANFIISALVRLDRELLGLRDSDIGSTL
jgi:hypothetical protein